MSKTHTFIGIMTGTSLDGIDLAIVDFIYDGSTFAIKEKYFNTYEYPPDLKKEVLDLIAAPANIYKVSQLNFAIAMVYSECVDKALFESGIFKADITGLSVHGQTVWHQPYKKTIGTRKITSTFQLCDLSVLNQLSGIPVYGNFRTADMALGGQGAPLVPIFDYYFLSEKDLDVVALNIGGISNMTYLPSSGLKERVIGFDTGPGNVLIDIAMRKYFNKEFDNFGNTARKGKFITKILDELMQLDYISKPYPKSTGREIFNVMFFNKYFSDELEPEDVLCTLSHFTAKSIAHNIIQNKLSVNKIVVTGGGAHNIFLMELLSHYMKNVDIIQGNTLGIGIDSKEAVCFAFLGLLNKLGLSGNIPSVTGACRECILGVRAGN